jgi:hypothetical protein
MTKVKEKRESKRLRLKVWPVALAKYFKFDRINFELNVTRSVSTDNILVWIMTKGLCLG